MLDKRHNVYYTKLVRWEPNRLYK